MHDSTNDSSVCRQCASLPELKLDYGVVVSIVQKHHGDTEVIQQQLSSKATDERRCLNLWFLDCSSLSLLLSSGDDGTNKEATSTGKLNQENEHIYNLWCSGRVCCEGMLIQLKVRMSEFVALFTCHHFSGSRGFFIPVWATRNPSSTLLLTFRDRVLNMHTWRDWKHSVNRGNWMLKSPAAI